MEVDYRSAVRLCVRGSGSVYRSAGWLCFRGELPFSIDVKGGENVVGRGVMIVGGVLVLPSMPKGEIVDQWL